MKKLLFASILLFMACYANAQSNPTPHNLSASDYQFTNWSATATAGTYPAGMVFQVVDEPSPMLIYSNLEGDWACGYNLGSRPRFLGLGQNGIAFLNTSSAQFDNCSSGSTSKSIFIGGVLLGLNTSNVNQATLEYDIELQSVGDGAIKRQYAVRLQYRVGTSSGFADVTPTLELSSQGNVAGTLQHKTYTLPASLLNQPNVQFRWLYYDLDIPNSDGTRPQFRLDEVKVSKSVTGIRDVVNGTHFVTVTPVPAPRDGSLYFSEKITGTVYNLQGKILQTLTAQNHLELSGMPSGMYFVKEQTGSVLKFVIE